MKPYSLSYKKVRPDGAPMRCSTCKVSDDHPKILISGMEAWNRVHHLRCIVLECEDHDLMWDGTYV